MTGLIITIVVISASVAIAWCICFSNSNTSNGNQTPATSVNRRPAPERTETGPIVYFANDRHGRSDREYRFNYKKLMVPGEHIFFVCLIFVVEMLAAWQHIVYLITVSRMYAGIPGSAR